MCKSNVTVHDFLLRRSLCCRRIRCDARSAGAPTGYDCFVTTSRATRQARSQPNYSGSANVSHRLVEMAALTATDVDRWLELRASNAQLDSPYFHQSFAAAVAATRPGVRVIVGEDGLGAVELVPASPI